MATAMTVTRLRPTRRGWIPSAQSIGTVALIIVMGLLQSSVFPYFEIAGVRPALVLVAVIVLAKTSSSNRVLVWAFASGLYIDLLSVSPVGTNALLFTVLVTAVDARGQHIEQANLVSTVLSVAVALLLYYPAIVLAMQLHGFEVDWRAQVVDRLPPASLLNIGSALILYPVLRLLRKNRRPISTPRLHSNR
jgi:rod shape-determining protein MreD